MHANVTLKPREFVMALSSTAAGGFVGTLLFDFRIHLRRGIGSVRSRSITEPDDQFPLDTRSGWRGDDPFFPSHSDGDFSAARTANGNGIMGYRSNGRSHPWADRGWMDHR